MSTYRETLARLGELAAVANFNGRGDLEASDEIQTGAHIWGSDGDELATVYGNLALDIDATVLARFWALANPAVILALVKQVEEMRKALEFYAKPFHSMSEARRVTIQDDGAKAREALAALDKEMP